MTTADSPAARTCTAPSARTERDGRRRRGSAPGGRAGVLVPVVAAALMVGGAAAASAATTSTTALPVCVRAGSPLVAPAADGSCPRYYRLTKVVGARGATGATGAAGAAGATGARGPQGATGPAGEQGPQGPAGPQGLAGLPGLQGEQGLQGIQGVPGAAGAAGADGAEGPQGAAGPQGVPGEQGPTGEQGPVGPAGPAGPEGPQGPAGPEGPAGATGPAGPQGDTGPAGADGTGPAWLDVGTPTAFAPGESHPVASVNLPGGFFLATGFVHVTGGAAVATTATLTCSWTVGGDGSLLGIATTTLKDPEQNLRDDVLVVTPVIVQSDPAGSSVYFSCTAVSSAGLTLTGTVLATQVTTATVT